MDRAVPARFDLELSTQSQLNCWPTIGCHSGNDIHGLSGVQDDSGPQ